MNPVPVNPHTSVLQVGPAGYFLLALIGLVIVRHIWSWVRYLYFQHRQRELLSTRENRRALTFLLAGVAFVGATGAYAAGMLNQYTILVFALIYVGVVYDAFMRAKEGGSPVDYRSLLLFLVVFAFCALITIVCASLFLSISNLVTAA